MQVNYKEKYLALKQRFEESVDVAFRLGFEQGAQAQQQQQMADQQQQIADQQAAEAQAAAGGGQFGGGAPGEESGEPNPSGDGQGGAQMSEDSRGVGQQAQGAGAGAGGMAGAAGPSELDQHIGELEGLMAKAEYGTEGWELLKKSLDTLKSYKIQIDLKKNEQLIKSIGANLRKPLKLNVKANHNIAPQAKAALSLQHKIVGDIMDTWDKQEKGIPTEITKILQSESIVKKE